MNKMCVTCGEVKPAKELKTKQDSKYGFCIGLCDHENDFLKQKKKKYE